MDYRRDLIPPLLALAISLGLHGALFGVRPLWWTQPPPEPVDTVVVQYLDQAGPAESAPQLPAPPAHDVPNSPPPAAAPPSPPPPPPAAAAPPEPEPPPPPPPAQPAPAAPPPPAPPAQPEPAPEPEVVPAPPTLSDLLPNASDLKRFAGRAELPDPTAAGVREATLSLGTEDLRYRGYMETVHAAIDRSEKWKEAVLMGGGGGVVVVRMTITSLGQLVSAAVTRSSGSHLLDSAALDAVQRANIPPFPSHWQVEKLHLHAQFNYELVTY